MFDYHLVVCDYLWSWFVVSNVIKEWKTEWSECICLAAWQPDSGQTSEVKRLGHDLISSTIYTSVDLMRLYTCTHVSFQHTSFQKTSLAASLSQACPVSRSWSWPDSNLTRWEIFHAIVPWVENETQGLGETLSVQEEVDWKQRSREYRDMVLLYPLAQNWYNWLLKEPCYAHSAMALV